MKTCSICQQEKEEAEFANMAPYGCTCTDTHFCASCILLWLGQNSRSRGGPLSLAHWNCPVCRAPFAVAPPPPAPVQPPQFTVHVQLFPAPTPPPPPPATTPEADVRQAMHALHQKWRDEYPTYPAQTTTSESLPLPDDRTLHFDVTLHEGAYFFAFVMSPNIASCIRYRCLVLPNDDFLVVVMNVVNERHRRFALLMDLIERYMISAEARATLLRTFNAMEGGMVLAESIQRIRCNYRYPEPTSEEIGRCFVRYIQRADRVSGRAGIGAFVAFFEQETLRDSDWATAEWHGGGDDSEDWTAN